MNQANTYQPDPKLDLVLERVVDVSPELIWKAWTTPELLVKWFTPAPWSTVACELDLRPGGKFATTMRSPEGQEFPNAGCVLEVVENRKLVFTSALGPDYRPVPPAPGEFAFTAIVLIEPHGDGAKYTAIAVHADEDGTKKHEAMGFHQGWGAAMDQMIALIKSW